MKSRWIVQFEGNPYEYLVLESYEARSGLPILCWNNEDLVILYVTTDNKYPIIKGNLLRLPGQFKRWIGGRIIAVSKPPKNKHVEKIVSEARTRYPNGSGNSYHYFTSKDKELGVYNERLLWYISGKLISIRKLG